MQNPDKVPFQGAFESIRKTLTDTLSDMAIGVEPDPDALQNALNVANAQIEMIKAGLYVVTPADVSAPAPGDA